MRTLLAIGILAVMLAACGGGGGGNGPAGQGGDFSVIVAGSGEFFAKIDQDASAVQRLTGPGLPGRGEAMLAHDSGADVMYAWLDRFGELATLDIDSGEYTILGPVEGVGALRALAYHAGNDTLYGIRNEALITLDPATLTSSVVGAIDLLNLGGMAYDASTDAFYAVQSVALLEQHLIRIDPATADTEDLGVLPALVVLLAVRDDDLYGLSRATPSQLFTIDKTDADAALVGNTGFRSPTGFVYGPGDRFLSTSRYGNGDGSVLVELDPANGSGSAVAALGFNPIGGMAWDPAAGVLYATDVSGDLLLRIDASTAQVTVIGPTGYGGIEGLAWDPVNEILYGIDTPTQSLLTLDTATGTGAEIGTVGPDNIRALAFDAAGGTLYGVDTNEGNLYTIATGDGATALVGALGQTGVEAIAFDSTTGTLYGINTDTDGNGQLLVIDTENGAATVAGDLGIGSDSATGMTFDPASGRLIANNAGSGALIVIDLATMKASGVNHTGAFFLGGLVHDEANARHYSVGSSNYLVALDPDTGSGTGIGPTGFDSIFSLAFDPDTPALYGYNGNDQTLVSIDLETGAGSAIGQSAPLSALSWDIENGILYGFGNLQLYTIDTGTGVATPLAASSSVDFLTMTYDPDNDTLYGVREVSDGSELYTIDRGTGDVEMVQKYGYVITGISWR